MQDDNNDLNKVELGKYTKLTEAELQQKLSQEEYAVTQLCHTETPFAGRYWDNFEDGIYVDVVTGEPLFSSTDKFESGCGWPSFTKPITNTAVIEKEDNSLGIRRIEVISRIGHSHLGHVFNDGPKDKGGLRYCINSVSLNFIPYKDLDSHNLSKLKSIFIKDE